MIPVKDVNGNIIRGVFKKRDGSIVVDDKVSLDKIKAQRNSVDNMLHEIDDLKNQITRIMELLNAKH